MQRLQLCHVDEPADALTLDSFDPPTPGPGQLLVEMHAATINASGFLYITTGRSPSGTSPMQTVGREYPGDADQSPIARIDAGCNTEHGTNWLPSRLCELHDRDAETASSTTHSV
jgi:hypothetical protein